MSITSHVAGPLGPDLTPPIHAHMDRCKQCMEHPFNLCAEGLRLLIDSMPSVQVIAELTYRSYRENRRRSPHIAPERWGAIYPQVQQLEARYREECAV